MKTACKTPTNSLNNFIFRCMCISNLHNDYEGNTQANFYLF